MKNLILPFLALLTFVFSCTNNDENETLEKNTLSYDVYVAGRENNIACYWKNNLKTNLTNGDNLSSAEIKVDNNDIYVTANSNINLISLTQVEFFWKNNIKSDIRQYLNISNSLQSFITGFAVKNGDVYFAGFMENPSAASNLEKFQLCYWKNGVKTVLFQSQFPSYAHAIHIGGADVYVSATKVDTNQNIQKGYFKKGIFHPVDASNISNFTKNNNGVHVLFEKNMKFYSKNLNTNLETLIGDYASPAAPISGKITSEESSTDLYSIYQTGWFTYFKNRSVIVPNFSALSYIKDLFVHSNNIYLIKYDTSNNSYIGKLFINGIETQSITSTSPNGLNYTGTFNSIFVDPN